MFNSQRFLFGKSKQCSKVKERLATFKADQTLKNAKYQLTPILLCHC